MQYTRAALLAAGFVSAVASAQTQVKPRVLLIVDTSGSMQEELTSANSTGGDGSNYLRTNYQSFERSNAVDTDFAYGIGLSTPADQCTTAAANWRGTTSRMHAAKTAVSNVVNGSGDVDWGLARYAGTYCAISNTATNSGFLIGCDANSDCGEDCCNSTVSQGGACGNPRDNTAACRCQDEDDCPEGYLCANITGRSHRACIRIDQCDDNLDCATGQTCNAATPRRCTCTSDDHCRQNEFCINNTCLYEPNLCFHNQYGATSRRGDNDDRPGECDDRNSSIPTTYGGSCGTAGTADSLGDGGCRSLYTCTANNQCESNNCAAIPGTLIAASGARACTCTTNADCDTLPQGADAQTHLGYTCQAGFCTYDNNGCIGDGAVRIVDPRAPDAASILLWLNGREDYRGTNGPFSTAGTPVATINVADPELRAVGSTPVGGSLRSAAAWYRSIKAAATDPQIACRPYITVIITDGVDTCEGSGTEDQWGPPAGARKFVQETVTNARVANKVYVLGLSVTATGDRDRLNAVATAGGTGLARFVSSSAEIEAALADILAESILFERCNGVDDDCDGLIDEGFGVYEECAPGATRTGGTCSSGRWTCVGTGTSTCSSGYNCLGGFCTATCSAGLGACQASGVRACLANGTAACNATPLPSPGAETAFGCNNRDDDCDGYIDDCTNASPNSCTCGGCTGTPEVCNGLDDDCVGGADNNPIDVGLPCGIGKCAGTTVCTGGVLSCNGPMPTPETCDLPADDDDCDGVIDNFTEACAPVSGQCDPGVRTCINGVFGMCTGIVPGGAEVCNGFDDDCDGTPDDNVTDPWVGTECCPTGNMADCCTPGHYQCVGGLQRCEGAVVKQAEICDGLDNDCNGTADDVPGIGQQCTDASVVTGGACRAEYQCLMTPGTGPLGLTCVQIVGPSGEVCNGLDDDCNGTPDDNITPTSDPRVGVEGGAPCMALPDGQMMPPCAPGITVCVAGVVECSGYVGPQENLCDGISRDCTGVPNTAGNCPAGFECFQGNCVTPCGGGEFPCLGGFVCDPTTLLCIPDACNKANCPDGQICELGSDGSAVCKDPCENITCGANETCELGVCKDSSCRTAGCPDGEICTGTTDPMCIPDPCADAMCASNEYCNSAGDCVRLCEQVCLTGTVCIDGVCQLDPCAGKNCPGGQLCVVQNGDGVCVESLCGNDCGGSNRVCCGATCRPDPCAAVSCPLSSVCKLDPSCSPQCVATDVDEVQIVGAGGGGVGCAAAGDGAGGVALFLIAALLWMRRRMFSTKAMSMMDEGA